MRTKEAPKAPAVFVLADLLQAVGLVECSERRSWYWRTGHAKAFHARRCGS